MKDLRLFGTEAFRLHPSGLRAMVDCPWRSVMIFLATTASDEHGVAGDTGSAVHAAAAAYHRGAEPAAALKEMRERLKDFPLADLQDAAELFLWYAADPRNQKAELLLVERTFRFQIAAAAEDPTQAPIQIEGTVDQVRREHGWSRVWDIKTSKKDPLELLRKHQMQAAAYCIGASIVLGERVHPGGLILPRRYNRGNAFFPFTWKFDDIEQILKPVRHAVARIRSGDVWHVPNDGCDWCGAKSPDLCLPKLQELKAEFKREVSP